MNCGEAEHLIQAERDGAPESARRAELDSHLAECESCRRLKADLDAVAGLMRADARSVAVPDAADEWEKLRGRLHNPDLEFPARKRVAPLVWLTAPAAAAAAIVLALLTPSPKPVEPQVRIASAAAVPEARAEYVEVADANASPVVYVDRESGWLVVWAVDDAGGNG